MTYSASIRKHDYERILILGANGPTGRLAVRQALDRGYAVSAVTRHPEAFPITDPHLHVIGGDATKASVIDAAVAETDAVICTIGASFTRRPVDVYSSSARLLIDAMRRENKKRLIVVTSSGLSTAYEKPGLTGRFFRSLMRDHVGKTVYDDMAKMESLVSASELDWTIVRPPGLTSQPGTGYAVAENDIEGGFGAREDLATMLLDQLDDKSFVRKIAAVTTPGHTATVAYMIRHEVLKR